MAENEFYLGFDFLGHSVPKKEVCKRRMMKKAKVQRAINVCVEDLATCLITLFLDEYGGGSRVHEYLWKVSVHLDLCITFSHWFNFNLNGGGLVTEVLEGLEVLVLGGF